MSGVSCQNSHCSRGFCREKGKTIGALVILICEEVNLEGGSVESHAGDATLKIVLFVDGGHMALLVL